VLNSRRTAPKAPVRISIWLPGIDPDNFGNTAPSKASREDFDFKSSVWRYFRQAKKVKARLKDFYRGIAEYRKLNGGSAWESNPSIKKKPPTFK